jgi:hypothetical protein
METTALGFPLAPRSDALLGKALTHFATVEQHLTVGLDKMLAASGSAPDLRRAVAEFITPSLALLKPSEREVVQYAQPRGR